MASQTVLASFKFGSRVNQVVSAIVITRDDSKVLELAELKDAIEASEVKEHAWYDRNTDKLALLGISKVKARATMNEF